MYHNSPVVLKKKQTKKTNKQKQCILSTKYAVTCMSTYALKPAEGIVIYLFAMQRNQLHTAADLSVAELNILRRY